MPREGVQELQEFAFGLHLPHVNLSPFQGEPLFWIFPGLTPGRQGRTP
jgi:hypothetical protein